MRSSLTYLIPGGLVVAAVVALLAWDLAQNIRKSPSRREGRRR